MRDVTPEIRNAYVPQVWHEDSRGARGYDLFSRLLKEKTRYQVVEPVLPMDVLGVYIILPEVAP